MKAVMFFSDRIKIKPHTATRAEHLDKPITVGKFAGERRVALYDMPNGDLRAERSDGGFIEGPEV